MITDYQPSGARSYRCNSKIMHLNFLRKISKQGWVIKKFKLSAYFKNVAIRPGKPILFAKIKGKQKAIFGFSQM